MRAVLRQYELIEKIKAYNADVDEDLLSRAYVFSRQAHGSQKRASGDPYFSHSAEVAGILTDLRLDIDSIVTGLLHDVVEDTDVTLEDIESAFGKVIANLVDGVTKFSRFGTFHKTGQAENFRKLALAMSDDIRVLIVKLADRLHNIRTLDFLPSEEKRRSVARETLDLYSPLAGLIGIYQVKDELEDRCFAVLNYEFRAWIKKNLAGLDKNDGDLIKHIRDELSLILQREGIKAEVRGRGKTPYSIWLKMKRKSISFEQLSDIIAFRAIVSNRSDCYKALGVLHNHFTVIPNRFKDYISAPKLNHYQSLHTCVLGPLSKRIEIQIRTLEMHDIAEHGIAAHWYYKTQQGSYKNKLGERHGRWFANLRELIDSVNPEEFLEHTKHDMHQKQVFCFTPKGDLIDLKRGASALDFAYAVHSEVGNKTIGAKINGRIVPLRTLLNNGDQVDIQTRHSQTPKPGWLDITFTSKARSKIRRYLRYQDRDQDVRKGHAQLEEVFMKERLSFTEKALQHALEKFKLVSIKDLYAEVGRGQRSTREVICALFPDIELRKAKKTDLYESKKTLLTEPKRAIAHSHCPVFHSIDPILAIRFAACCYPLPGDRVIGIVNTGSAVSVHVDHCHTVTRFANQQERLIDLTWEQNIPSHMLFTTRLDAIFQGNEDKGISHLFAIVNKHGGKVNRLRIRGRSASYAEATIDLEIESGSHLENILAALRASPGIHNIHRRNTF